MNENLNLVKILEDCPKGTKLYSTVYGEVEFDGIENGDDFPVKFVKSDGYRGSVTAQGLVLSSYDGECILFPSREERNWSEFTAPWYKKEMDTNSMSNKDDERLRKTAIGFLKDFAEQGYENAVECIDWLEKQGEQEEPQVYETEDGEIITYSETDGYKFVEPKFHEGDWVVNKFGDSSHIDSLDKKNYQVSDEKGNYNYFPISKQDKMHLWTIQDAKDGDVIFYDEGWICIFKCIHGIWYSSYCFITDDGEFHTGYERHAVDSTIHGNAHPATKEQRDALMKAMNDAGYKWNPETKTLEKLIETKFNVGDKFDPKTLKPFDKILVRDSDEFLWRCGFYSHTIENGQCTYKYVTLTECGYKRCIPYNEDTKHLVNTADEAPEYYRYWED